MGPLNSQLLVPPPAADPLRVGLTTISVYVPGKIPGFAATSNTATYADVNYFLATCRAADQVGNLVYAVGGTVDQVATADCGSPLQVVGMIVNKSDDFSCTVQTFGLIKGVYDNLQVNTTYFLGHGTPITPDQFDSTVEFVQAIGSATDSVTFYLNLSGSVVRRDTSAT